MKKRNKKGGERKPYKRKACSECVGEGSFFKERWMLGGKKYTTNKTCCFGESEKAWCKVVEIED